jgi:hypothetical protein
MKKYLPFHPVCCLIFISVFFCATNSYAGTDAALSTDPQLAQGAEKDSTRFFETEFLFNAGYRRDELDWNIAGDTSGKNPNILSELTWEDLEIFQVKFQNKTVIPRVFYIRAAISYGWIYEGDNQDSDYLGDNRTLEFSRSNNSTDDDDVLDASVGIGYPFRFGANETWTITPLVGYSYHEQNLNITDGEQTIATEGLTPPLGPFPGLDSTYETEWKGPWVGLDLYVKSKKKQSLAQRIEPYLSVEYHWADYDAEADWNLREDFKHPKSFTHEADADGFILGLGFNFFVNPHLLLNFNFDYQDWSTDHGTDKTFFADGTTAKTRLNEVNWTSHAVSLGVNIRF